MMGSVLLTIMPLALAASLNPTGVLLESSIISGPGNGRRNALLFVIGATSFLIVLGLAVMFVFNHTVLPSVHHARLSAAIDIGLGMLIALAVLGSMVRGGGTRRSQPASRARHRPYLAVGLLFMAVNTSTNIPFVAASKGIADGGLPLYEEAITFSLLVLITLSLLAFPVVFAYAAPVRAESVMRRLRRVMDDYGLMFARGFFLLVAGYLVWKGIYAIGS